jgi:hypothetical protein
MQDNAPEPQSGSGALFVSAQTVSQSNSAEF